MDIEETLYRIGTAAENGFEKIRWKIGTFLFPKPSESPPRIGMKISGKKGLTAHEAVSVSLQLCFVAYLLLSLGALFTDKSLHLLVFVSVVYFPILRYMLKRYGQFLIDEKPYRVFYTGISVISFLAFLGYSIIRSRFSTPEYVYAYIGAVVVAVLLFRHYFKTTFGRDYTYGVVEDVKNDLVRVFVHDDIAANIKPGYYWVPKVEDAEPGRVVKLLVEDRPFRSAKPVRILEVYLSQSSQSSTEPKKDTE